MPQLKICGLTRPEQVVALSNLGVHALGFICVPSSPRYVAPDLLRHLSQSGGPFLARIGVFADRFLPDLIALVQQTGLTGVQLHGNESVAYCTQLRQALPGCTLIKALRLREPKDLRQFEPYWDLVDAVLLDAYHPSQLGGTGQTLAWQQLQDFRPPVPWLLAGGLTPENLAQALDLVSPAGVDLSSGVELSPGNKDLERVRRVWRILQEYSQKS